MLSSILLLAASLFAIYHAHHAFYHYLLFSIIPVSFCVANVLGRMHRADRGMGYATLARGVFAALFLFPIGFAALTSESAFSHRSMPPRRDEVLAIARYVKPGDRMAVWAWRPEF